MSKVNIDYLRSYATGRINLNYLKKNQLKEKNEGICKKATFLYNGKKLYFKANYTSMDNGYAEVFFYHLANKMNLFALRYDIAEFRSKKGVISVNFKMPEEQEMQINHFVESVLGASLFKMDYKRIKNAIDNNDSKYEFKEDKNIIKNNILKMILFDAVIMNEDRHFSNIVFLKDKENKLRISPIFDHGFAAGFMKKRRYYENNPEFLISKYQRGLNLFKYDKESQHTAQDIFLLHKENKKLANNFLKKYNLLDFAELFNEIEKKDDMKFTKVFKKAMCYRLNSRRIAINRYFSNESLKEQREAIQEKRDKHKNNLLDIDRDGIAQ